MFCIKRRSIINIGCCWLIDSLVFHKNIFLSCTLPLTNYILRDTKNERKDNDCLQLFRFDQKSKPNVPITRFSVCLGPIANRCCIYAKNICYFLADHHRPDMPPPRLNVSAESAPTHAQVPLVNVPKSTSSHYCINKYPCPTVNIMSFANKIVQTRCNAKFTQDLIACCSNCVRIFVSVDTH